MNANPHRTVSRTRCDTFLIFPAGALKLLLGSCPLAQRLRSVSINIDVQIGERVIV